MVTREGGPFKPKVTLKGEGPLKPKLNNIEIKYTFFWSGKLKRSFTFISSGNDILGFKLLTCTTNFETSHL